MDMLFVGLFTTISMFLTSMIMITSGKSNIMLILMALELLLLSTQMNFVLVSMYSGELMGQLYALLMLTVAAGESAMGLALIMLYYRLRGSMSLALTYKMKA